MKSIITNVLVSLLPILFFACSKSSSPSGSGAISQYTVTTLAGSGTAGFSNSTGTAASFNYPIGISVDAAGNLYVGDEQNEVIREITPAGVVSTYAGTGQVGMNNGLVAQATFSLPAGTYVDSAGDVFVADYSNNVIREISAGSVSTAVGTGVEGYAEGPFFDATFTKPSSMAMDHLGNLYIADAGNNKIRVMNANGVVSTFAGSETAGSGNGTGTGASFNYPYALAVDQANNVYVADSKNNEIRKITPSGVVSTLAGSTTPGAANGTGSAAGFDYPAGLAVDGAGNVYVADMFNHVIRMITSGGVVSTIAGNATGGNSNGVGTAASFMYPTGICLDQSGNLYVTDQGNQNVRKITTQQGQ